jgi:hypothetical protein
MALALAPDPAPTVTPPHLHGKTALVTGATGIGTSPLRPEEQPPAAFGHEA